MGDISNVDNALWKIGEQRTQMIHELAEQRRCSHASVLEAANRLNVSVRYIYKMIKRYRLSGGLLTSLIPGKTDGGKGKSRLSKQQETIISEVVEEMYLTVQRNIPAHVIEEIRKRCSELAIEAPSNMTIRRRLRSIPQIRLKKRKAGSIQTRPVVGCFPEAKYPLSVLQIDHTPVDIILVDPVDRLAIGRPYLTVAIDVYSRCIAGFLLTLEAPSAVSVGLCLTHVAMEKGPLLERQNINAVWPIYGKPEKIYVDNGSEFHSTALTRGCAQHGIQIEYRPPGQPHYGGIIERVIGTLMTLVHAIPGTTFSNVHERGEYDSDQKACLTLAELEHWLIITITKYYHLKLHTGIDLPPLERYQEGAASMTRDGVQFVHVANGKAFLIDFLPIEHRLLRRDGFVLDHIVYYANALRSLISERKNYGKFLIRRDPRDLSRIYVYLSNDEGYLEVPYRTMSRPAISLFEHRMALKRLHDRGKQAVDEHALFSAIEEIRGVVKTAVTTTRALRRMKVRMAENKKVQPPMPVKTAHPTVKIDPKNIKPFEHVELL